MALSPLDIFLQQIDPTFVKPQSGLWDNWMHSFEKDKEGGTELQGHMELAPLLGGKKFMRGALASRNEQAEQFGKQSDSFNIEMLKQAQAAETFSAGYDRASTRLGTLRSGMSQSASSASSAREYSGIAQNTMQATGRYLSELEKFQAPTQQDLSFTFKDPITGQDLMIDSKFEDVYKDQDPKERARTAVYDTFAKSTDMYREQLQSNILDEYGNFDDWMYGGKHLSDLSIHRRRELARDRLDYSTYEKKVIREGSDYIARYNEMERAINNTDQTAEAMAMAEMTDYGGTMSYTNKHGGDGWMTTDMSQSLLFFNADHNKLLDDMFKNTTERMEIARLDDRTAVETEFNRRKDAALSQRALSDSQLRRNQAQAQGIAEEKQRVRQLMEEQRIEYAQTLSSFGSSPVNESGGDSVTFGDIRPQ